MIRRILFSNNQSSFRLHQKGSFFFFEILIALTLITSCSLCVIRFPLFFFRSQIADFIAIESERIAEMTYCEIREQIDNNEIRFKDVYMTKTEALFIELPSISCPLKNFKTLQLHRRYRIYFQSSKKREGKQGKPYFLINLDIVISPKPNANDPLYTYGLCATCNPDKKI